MDETQLTKAEAESIEYKNLERVLNAMSVEMHEMINDVGDPEWGAILKLHFTSYWVKMMQLVMDSL